MRTFLMLCLVALITGSSYAQKGTANYLDEKRGFKCFVLGEHISKYSDRVEKIKGSDNNSYAVTDTTLLSIGEELPLKHIIIKTYNDSIYSISILALPKYSFKLRNVLITAYGAWSFQPNKYIEKYHWVSTNKEIDLYFDSESNKWCYATFKDLTLDLKRGKKEYQKTQEATNDL